MDEFVSLQSSGACLHGILRMPQGRPRAMVVICDPFAEEKKCAHRALTDTARALQRAGVASLRFDYRGCGDSEGDFAQFTPADWAEDTGVALAFGRERAGNAPVILAGLRMGAAVAVEVAVREPDLAGLILWEPVIDGAAYVKQNLRRSLIKAMITDGDGFSAEAVSDRHAADMIDFDGYLLSAATREQLEGIDLSTCAAQVQAPSLLLTIGPRDEPSAALVALAEKLPHSTAAGVRLEPIWNRIGLIDASPMIDATLGWLDEQGAL